MQIDQKWLDKLAQAAEDSMLDNMPTVRAEGHARMLQMLTPVAVLQLIARAQKNTAT